MPVEHHRVEVRIDALLAERGLTLTQLADKVGVTLANLSVLKNGHARAIRFTTLTALCDVLECQPGDLLEVGTDDPAADDAASVDDQPATNHRQNRTDHVTTAA